MNIKRLISAVLAAVLCCVSLAGCSGMSLTGSDVLTPPMAHGARSELQELIRESAGGAYSLVYPSSGELQSAVISRDIDGDGLEEAIAMFRAKDDTVRILSLSRSSFGYSAAGEAVLNTALILKAEFADLDGDGTEEFIVTYPDGDTSQTSLTVIRMGSDYAQADMPAACSAYLIEDLDNDPGRDILLFSLPNPFASAAATLLGYRDGALITKSACEIDSALTDYPNITCGSISADVRGVFVDGVSAEYEYSTQVLYCDPEQGLLNPLFVYSGYESTRRFCRIFSSDIDGDGLTELPVCSLFDFEEGEDPDTVCSRITWNNYDIDEIALITKRTAVLCDDRGSLFNISDNRVGAVTARHSGADTMEIYAWEYRDGAMRRTDLLLTVRSYPKGSYDGFDLEETILGETDSAVYTYQIAAADHRLGYTDAEVRGSFRIPQNQQAD